MAYKYRYDEEGRDIGKEKERHLEALRLKTDRNPWKLIILSYLTLGLYEIFFFAPFADDLDRAAARHDGKKTMSFLVAYLIGLVTVKYTVFAWHYEICSRIEEEMSRLGIVYDFGTTDFWGWEIFGSLILIGPFVYLFKLCRAMNLLCADYNRRLDEQIANIGDKNS